MSVIRVTKVESKNNCHGSLTARREADLKIYAMNFLL